MEVICRIKEVKKQESDLGTIYRVRFGFLANGVEQQGTMLLTELEYLALMETVKQKEVDDGE